MKFTDGKELLEVYLYDEWGTEWTEDFYDNAPTPDENGVCHVPDARYPLEQALDMLHGEGDYDTPPATNDSIDYNITDIASGKTVDSGSV